MKVSVSQENLAKGLGVVGRATNARSTLPVLGNVLLTTDDGKLRLAATDLEVGIVHWIAASVTEDGGITVPARTLTDLVAALPKEQVEMALNERTQTLNLHAGRTEANVKGLAMHEFPIVQTPDKDKTYIYVNAKMLREAINQVAIAAASAQDRPTLTGVLMKFVGDQLTLAAADGFRLAVRNITLASPVTDPFQVIVPARALAELARISGEQESPIAITVEKDKKVFFSLDDAVLSSQLIPGNFPDFTMLIPTSHATKTVVDTAALLKACRTASIFARDSANIARLHAKNGTTPATLTVSAISAETGDNEGVMDAEIEGQEIEIAFNVRYLIEMLSNVKTPKVTLETNTNASPGAFRPVGDDAYVHVIMPMHLGR
jgi:DNA polymerase-3 subunit beta